MGRFFCLAIELPENGGDTNVDAAHLGARATKRSWQGMALPHTLLRAHPDIF
jgi:hypothetical protein